MSRVSAAAIVVVGVAAGVFAVIFVVVVAEQKKKALPCLRLLIRMSSFPTLKYISLKHDQRSQNERHVYVLSSKTRRYCHPG